MRAILIDPIQSIVDERRLDSPRDLPAMFGPLTVAGRFPNGDVILVSGENVLQRECFSVGGDRPRQSFGVVVGRKDDVGDRRSAVSSADTIRSLTKFSSIPDFEFETTPKSVTEESADFVRVLGSTQPEYVNVEPLDNADMGACFRNVGEACARYGGLALYGWILWERSRLFLTAEFHAVWKRPDGSLVDITPKADGEERILFSADPRYPSSFNWLKRPGNRRHRLYRPVPPDIAAILKDLGGPGRALNRRRAAKAGRTLEEWIALKHTDPLVSEIEAMFRSCDEMDAITDVHIDGLFCQQPARLTQLEDLKRAQHGRILALARETFADESSAEPEKRQVTENAYG